MFHKIVTRGDADIIVRHPFTSTVSKKTSYMYISQTPPPNRLPPTRFLSRFDKSATNIKESQIFISIGQVFFSPILFIDLIAIFFWWFPRFLGRLITQNGTININSTLLKLC